MKETFQRPTAYWLHRAEKLRQEGNLMRAAVLQRHALRADPASGAACAAYVLTLRQMHCYEASNREALFSLARDPQQVALFGIVGLNLLDLGLRQEGLDALNLYLADPPAIPPVWQDEAYDRMDECEQAPPPERCARLDGLLRIAASRLMAGDTDGAARALHRASARTFRQPNAQRECLQAMLLKERGDTEDCVRRLRRAIAMRPRDAKTIAGAACILWDAGQHQQARAALWRAAVAARGVEDELPVCMAADFIGMPEAARAMLRRSLEWRPNRAPTCQSMSACLLRLGRLDEALSWAHKAREIDPDDMAGEVFFTRLTQLAETAPSADEVRRAAKDFSYYSTLTYEELSACTAPLIACETDEKLAEALTEDEHLYRRFLYVLSLNMDWAAALLYGAAPHLPKETLALLLRRVLVQSPQSTLAKQYAGSTLPAAGEQPPYLLWQEGRMGWADPTRQPAPTPSFLQRMFTRRIRQARKLCPMDSGVIPYAMRIIAHMNADERRMLINDAARVWPLALASCYRYRSGLPRLRMDFIDPVRTHALAVAMEIIENIDSAGGNPHEDH